MTCKKCGLPEKLCVCDEIIKERLKKLVKKLFHKDDFKYCHTCQCYHYPGCHISKDKSGEE